MASDGYPYLPASPQVGDNPPGTLYQQPWPLTHTLPPPQHRYWLHLLLLILTFLSTSIVGAGLQNSFRQGRPYDFDSGLDGYLIVWSHPAYLLDGLAFSLTLLIILLAHEFGHYIAARYYAVDVTLPFFIPAPTLIGTMGAFIRIRSAILSKRVLFDIGIAGPLAGFAMLLLPLIIGVSLSKTAPNVAVQGDLIFGTPLALRLLEALVFPGVPVDNILLHPIARAAWVGLLATALNLLPIGQLDGGHILYALIGERTRLLSRVFIALLIPMGFFFAYSWLLWAVLLFFFGMRHPAIFDPHPIGPVRRRLALLALLLLVLSFTPSPVRTG